MYLCRIQPNWSLALRKPWKITGIISWWLNLSSLPPWARGGRWQILYHITYQMWSCVWCRSLSSLHSSPILAKHSNSSVWISTGSLTTCALPSKYLTLWLIESELNALSNVFSWCWWLCTDTDHDVCRYSTMMLVHFFISQPKPDYCKPDCKRGRVDDGYGMVGCDDCEKWSVCIGFHACMTISNLDWIASWSSTVCFTAGSTTSVLASQRRSVQNPILIIFAQLVSWRGSKQRSPHKLIKRLRYSLCMAWQLTNVLFSRSLIWEISLGSETQGSKPSITLSINYNLTYNSLSYRKLL